MVKRTSVDHNTMRAMNLALILDTLRTQAPLSRATLAHKTGLNKATVSSIVRELAENGFVRELGTSQNGSEVGRPAINLTPNPQAGYFIGAEINVDFISIVIANFAVEIVARRFESTVNLHTQQAILDRFFFLLQESVEQITSSGRPLFGIGIGLPGLVEQATGDLLFAPNLGWENVPLRSMLQNRFQVPIYVHNEANLAALGERYFGAGQDADWILYASFGIGIGGGIINNGRLQEGATGFAGEIGHMSITPQGVPCNCGSRGCWETVASQWALFERIQKAIAAGQPSSLQDDLRLLSIDQIVAAAANDDTVAQQALHETGVWMGVGLANLLNILNPQRIIIGGPLSRAHAFLLPAIHQTVRERAWRWSQDEASIVFAKHGQDAAVVGAVASVYRELLNDPRRWLQYQPTAQQPLK